MTWHVIIEDVPKRFLSWAASALNVVQLLNLSSIILIQKQKVSILPTSQYQRNDFKKNFPSANCFVGLVMR